MMKNFKILIAGNMVNQGYITAKELRKKGYHVDLLTEENSHITADPAYLEPELKNNYPEWIKFFNKKKSSWKLQIIKLMRKYDLIHSWVEFSIFAQFSGKPFVVNTQGSDFRELSNSKTIRGYLLKRSYKKTKLIIYNQPDFWNVNKKILNQKGFFIPIIWDDKNWPKYERRKENDKLTIFHPTNLDFRLKKNQILFEGFQKFIKQFPNTHLVIVDRGIDSKKTHKIIKELNLENHTEFVSGPLNKIEMAKFYINSDIVADQFTIGSMGSIALESMIYEKPLITYIDKEVHKKSYGSIPPLISAKSPSEIFEGLLQLKDKNERMRIGKELNTWFKKYHSTKKISDQIELVYNSFEKGLDTKSILNELKSNLSS
jgi:glycosyltransferase involved in cell wall biosynthesis